MHELKIGYNPNLLLDTKKILKLSMNEDEIYTFITLSASGSQQSGWRIAAQ